MPDIYLYIYSFTQKSIYSFETLLKYFSKSLAVKTFNLIPSLAACILISRCSVSGMSTLKRCILAFGCPAHHRYFLPPPSLILWLFWPWSVCLLWGCKVLTLNYRKRMTIDANATFRSIFCLIFFFLKIVPPKAVCLIIPNSMINRSI